MTPLPYPANDMPVPITDGGDADFDGESYRWTGGQISCLECREETTVAMGMGAYLVVYLETNCCGERLSRDYGI